MTAVNALYANPSFSPSWKWIQGCETVIFEGEKNANNKVYKTILLFMHHKTWKRKYDITSLFFGSASFLCSPFLQGSEKVSLSRDIYQREGKKVRALFFSLLWGKKSFPENSSLITILLGLYLNFGTGSSPIFLVKVLMMVKLFLSTCFPWFYPKEMETIGNKKKNKNKISIFKKLSILSNRFGYFVFEQPGVLDYSDEGGPTDSCSPNMSNGRGPFKSTKNFQKKYGLTLTAATFLIIDYNEASMQIACEWQKCIGDTINLVSPLKCGNEEKW